MALRPDELSVLVLHGPNLNLLGNREPEIYGAETLREIDALVIAEAADLGASVRSLQSNHEGELIDALHAAADQGVHGVLFNLAGLSHTSIALRDAITAISVPCVEVHISNVFAREPFRHRLLTAGACVGSISGFGAASYTLGLRALIGYLRTRNAE